MTLLQYLSAFRVYSVDALVLALGVSLITSLLKKTVLKKCPKKVFVFLPFLIGFIFYASYRAILTMSAEPFTSGLSDTFEGGFACGCAATLYYVVYEQFFRTVSPAAPSEKAQTTLPVAQLLEGLVPENELPRIAQTLTEGSKDKSGNDLLRFVLETLRGCVADGELTEGELLLCAQTVSKFLETIKV
ncbi:MAG: hypothetical protein K2K12_02840 [Clostridia bacterium]|nr:hypothetical protein [Clostridia bacterium]